MQGDKILCDNIEDEFLKTYCIKGGVDESRDSDKDGLTDVREKSLGTNPNRFDSDEDGLNDQQEIEVYETDPLDSDTDDDGYLDGHEVKHGYNPAGEGKLVE